MDLNKIIDTKKIILTTENSNQNTSSKKIVREKKEPKKRVEPQKWKLESSEFCNFENQIELIHQIKNNNYLATDNYNSKCTNEILKMEGMSGKKTRQYTFIIIFVQFKEYDI